MLPAGNGIELGAPGWKTDVERLDTEPDRVMKAQKRPRHPDLLPDIIGNQHTASNLTPRVR